MPEVKQYLRLKRVTRRSVSLLLRVDLADGQRFRPGDAVAACSVCRGVSKREHWLKERACPFCGSTVSMPFNGLRELEHDAEPLIRYSRFDAGKRGFYLMGAAAAVLCVAVLALVIRVLITGLSPRTGFFRSDDGHYYYVAQDGTRYMDGSYAINGKVYTFSQGLLEGPAVITVNGAEQHIDENGLSYTGWLLKDGVLAYFDGKKVITERLPEADGAGFYTLEGLGRIFLDDSRSPVDGWVVFEGSLYHMKDGQAAPVEGMDGDFDEDGRYLPDQAGFVEPDDGSATYLMNENGNLLTGLVPWNGFVYATDASGRLCHSGSAGAGTGLSVEASGILKPDADVRVDLNKGSVVLAADTGVIRKGWILLGGAVYCTDQEGYIRCRERCADPEGLFDDEGRFIPDQPGRVELDHKKCWINGSGELMTGAVLDGGWLYLYDDRGDAMADQVVNEVGSTDHQGCFKPFTAGMYLIDGHYYCFGEQGSVLTGWQSLGKMYYFDPETGCLPEAGSKTIGGGSYPLSSEGFFLPAEEGLYTLDGKEYYIYKDGSLAVGWRIVDGKLTLFDEKTGVRQSAEEMTRAGWIQRNGSRFYVFENGDTAQGWQLINGFVYYFDVKTGAVVTGSRIIADKRYDFRKDGVLQLGSPAAISVDGQLYRIGTDGSPEGGFLYQNGHLYYFDADTCTLSTRLPAGLDAYTSAQGGYIVPAHEGYLAVEDGAFYVETDGNVLTCWFVRGGLLYYADSTTGLLAPDGESDDGRGMFRNGAFTLYDDGSYTAGGKTYVFADGKLADGWIRLSGNAGIGYTHAGEVSYAAVSVTIEGESCRFDAGGRYIPGVNKIISMGDETVLVLADGTLPQNAGSYLLPDMHVCAVGAGGTVARSLSQLGGDDDFGSVTDGVVRPVNSGLLRLDDGTYLLTADGTAKTGYTLFENKLYLFDMTDGRMVTDSLGFGPDGCYLPETVGIQLVANRGIYMFKDVDGTVATGMVRSLEDEIYLFGEDGRMCTGLVDYADTRYYFDISDGTMQCSKMLFGIWDEDDRYDFYAGEDGRLAVGWTRVDGVLRYFDEKGHMLYNTVIDGIYINLYGEAKDGSVN